MRFLIAPDSFKGTLTAGQAAAAIADGLRRVLPGATVDPAPMADGGEGTVEALVQAAHGEYRRAEVRGPLGDWVTAQYGVIDAGRTAVIEMAAAAGLTLVTPSRRDVLRASTFGVGQLMRHAIEGGATRLLMGIGGSATNDGGCGMAQALGVCFRGPDGAILADGLGGGDLSSIASIDARSAATTLRAVEVLGLCDVRNPLIGPHGAARTYGPQKGASAEQVLVLDAGLANLAGIVQRDLGVAVAEVAGAGAAGGFGAGLLAFAGARLQRGAEVVMEHVGLAERCDGVRAIITGEGRLDEQSFQGKVVSAVAALGRSRRIPVYVIAGQVSLAPPAWRDWLAGVAAVADLGNASSDDPAAALSERAAWAGKQWFGDQQ